MRRLVLGSFVLILVACGGSGSSSNAPTPPPTQQVPDGGTSTSTSTGAVAVLELDGTPGQGKAPDTESFSGSASYSKDASAQITDYRWTFGDGSDTQSGAKVTHTFEQPGTYAVTLVVTDSNGSTGSSSLTVQVYKPDDNTPHMVAIAKFDGTTGHGTAPDTEKFDGTASHSTDSTATLDGCRWSFGDGATASGCKVQHTYQSAGSYTVTLTAADSDGNTGDATLPVNVDPPTTAKGVVAVAAFDGTSGSGVVPDTEKFDGTGSHSRDPSASLTGCQWDFGDGASATGCKTQHTFSKAGDFTVTLTATDSNGDHGTATLAVSVRAQPAGRVLWQRSLPSRAFVGSDWDQKVAVAYGPTVAMLDPSNGKTLWSHSYPLPSESMYSFNFAGPIYVLPGTDFIYAEDHVWGGPAPYANICHYNSAGDQTCYGGSLEDEGAVLPLSMGPDGAISWGFDGEPGESATRVSPDGSSWSANLRANPQYDGTRVMEATPEPGGDLVVAVQVPSGYTYDGQAVGPNNVLMRINPQGHLVWWKAVPFSVLDLGTTSRGTIVAVVRAAGSFQWGNDTAKGTALVVMEGSGAMRFARTLFDGLADGAQLSVLPLGRVAIALNRPSCGGGLVLRYDLTGTEQWHRDFAAYGCDVELAAVSIRPDDVLVSGELKGTTDFGSGELPAGGFVLDLGN